MAVEDTAQDIIDDARLYAQNSFDFVTGLINILFFLVPAEIDLDDPPPIDWDDNFTPPELPDVPPEFTGSLQLPPDEPALGQLQSVHIPEFDNIGDVPDITTPGFNFSVPDPLEAFTEPVPDVGDVSIPASPAVSFPNPPTLRDIETPVVPEINTPTFDIPLPPSPPAIDPDKAITEYRNEFDNVGNTLRANIEGHIEAFTERYAPDNQALFESLMAKLNNDLDGGTGIPESVEQQIFDRARGRIDAQNVRSMNTLQRETLRRGFELPDRTAIAFLWRSDQEASTRASEAAIDIAAKQADLEQANIRATVSESANIQAQVRQGAISYGQLLLGLHTLSRGVASDIANLVIESYNLALRQYEAEVTLYRTHMELLDLKIRAELMKVQIFEAQVRVAQLLGTLNEQDLRLMQQTVDIERAKIDVYAEQLRAVSVELDTKRLRLELFRAKIEGYQATATAKEMEYRAFEAAIRGDEAKLRGEIAKLEAYRAEIDAKTAKGSFEVARMQGDTEYNRQIVETYAQLLRAWVTRLDANKTQFEGDLQVYTALLRQYEVQLQQKIDELRVQLEYRKEQAVNARQQAANEIEVNIQRVGLLNARLGIIADAVRQGSSVYGNIAGAALSAQNTMVQLAATTVS